MMASLFSGVSGLRNHQVKMNVIGNNIANINTVGYKASRVTFQEALVQTFRGAGRPSAISGGTNPIQLGLGMQVATIDTLFQQGGLETTGQITDLAIQGSGFFVLGDNGGNRFYTRAGAFGFDANSNLVDPSSGLFVLGRMADSGGNILSLTTVDKIVLPFGQQDPAKATEIVSLANNLDSSATNSVASLVQAGASGIAIVTGTAADGVGGKHTVSISGAQAQSSVYTSTTSGVGLASTLASLGVTDFNGFQITIDGSRIELISGLNSSSTVEDLINSLNQVVGITATLSGSGEILVTRDKAGSQSQFFLQSSGALVGNIVREIFLNGAADGSTFVSSGGAATTFVAADSFTPNKGAGAAAGPSITALDLVIDENSGLVVGLGGLGGGGVDIAAGSSGLQATTAGNELIIDTDDTVHTMSINVFDSQGGRHTLSMEFSKSIVTNRWEWTASTLGQEAIVAGGTGYVIFQPDGSLSTFDFVGGTKQLVIDPRNGAANLNITFDAGTTNAHDGLTGFGSGRHTASIVGQDGYGLGILEKIDIDQTGNISGIFSNGVSRVLAQIILADFTNQGGLRKSGKGLYQPTANSGQAVEGVAGVSISGQIFSGALESSSVDIAQEFTAMITAQRGFQANARIITTSDSMLDELVNIKR